MKNIIIIGAGPAGLYCAYELIKNNCKDKIIIIDKGNELYKRHCPSPTKCINCETCSIMNGFGGAGAFSDGKFNITNNFGGTLYKKIGDDISLKLQEEVDEINRHLLSNDNRPKLYSSKGSKYHKICLQNGMQLLDANIRHLGTDNNYVILEQMYLYLKNNNVEFHFKEEVTEIQERNIGKYLIETITKDKEQHNYLSDELIIAVGRSGSHWIQNICKHLKIETKSNRVDLGVRVELPYEIFSDLTNELYESKIVYKTKTYQDYCRTFCMNPKGSVVSENTNGIITVNGHSYESDNFKTNNTNFALLVSKHFTEPFNDSNEYAESIIKLSNMLGGGNIVQKFGDLIRGQRTTQQRLNESSVKPTLKATPGDLSLVLPKRILDDIIEMIYQLDKIAPGTANDDTLLYGVEAKFYNFEVDVTEKLRAKYNLYIIGDGSGITHSLSQAAASGLFVARNILNV